MIFWNTQSVFIRVPKTASTAILYSLLDCSEKCSADEFNQVFDALKPQFLHKHYSGDPHHVSFQTLRAHTPMIHRETIDSYFKFAFVRNPFDRIVSIYKYIEKIESIEHGDFKSFVLNNLPDENDQNKIWLCDQVSQVKDCDFIGRFENLQEDFNFICNKLGIKRNPLPFKNQTDHANYREYYDEKTLQVITQKYKRDIEYFDYKF